MTRKRFLDQNKTYCSFSGHQLVVCPQCARCADVIVIDPEEHSRRRANLTCRHCGYNAQAEVHWLKTKPQQPSDAYFHQPLWLQAPCEGHVLWAYNCDHLTYIREYIAANLREHTGMGTGQYYSAVNRLPRWAKLATNRDTVLTIIDKMLHQASKK